MSEEIEIAGTEAGPESETGSPAGKPAKTLAAAQWEEIRNAFELGTATTTELAKKYGVSIQAVSQYFKRHGIVKGSRAHELTEAATKAAKDAAAATAASFANNKANYIEETKNEAYKWSRLIGQMTMKVMHDTLRAAAPGVPPNFSNVRDEWKALRVAAATVRETIEVRSKILDIDNYLDAQELPEIVFRDINDQDIAEHLKKIADDGGEIILEDTIEIDPEPGEDNATPGS